MTSARLRGDGGTIEHLSSTLEPADLYCLMRMLTVVEQAIHYFILSGGLLAIMPLLLIATLAVGLERLWLLRRMFRAGTTVQAALRRIRYRDAGALRTLRDADRSSLPGHLVATAMASRGETADDIETHLDEEIMRATPLLLRGVWVLDTAVTIAPLLGLFGTIIGLIQTFNVLSAHGGPSEVTGGIADALISTAAGVLIAVVAVCFLNGINALMAAITFQLETTKLALLNRLHGHGVALADEPATVRTLQPAAALTAQA